jgi:hypothetical protein
MQEKNPQDSTTSQTARYLKYAIGEIFLVVIGILIALSINNWNEARKEEVKEKEYLNFIKLDLIEDQNSILSLIPTMEVRLNHFKKIDSTVVNFNSVTSLLLNDTLVDPKYFVYPLQSFRPKLGTYNALISEGKTGIISNRALFNSVQELYEVYMARIADANAYIDSKSREIMWEKRDYLYFDVQLISPTSITNPDMIASLNYLQTEIARYVRLLKRLSQKIDLVIQDIDNDLEQ